MIVDELMYRHAVVRTRRPGLLRGTTSSYPGRGSRTYNSLRAQSYADPYPSSLYHHGLKTHADTSCSLFIFRSPPHPDSSLSLPCVVPFPTISPRRYPTHHRLLLYHIGVCWHRLHARFRQPLPFSRLTIRPAPHSLSSIDYHPLRAMAILPPFPRRIVLDALGAAT